MGHQIIKQPNSKFAIWSTIVDNFILIDASEEDIVKHFITEATETIEHNVKHIINELNSGIKPYNLFTMTWKEALKKVEEVHGKKEETNNLNKVAKSIQKEIKSFLFFWILPKFKF